jgi:predicted metal-binding membrane protein
MANMSFSQLLYRYFFFGWLFKDVSRGNQFERMAAWRHNQERAHWLPTYMRRWLVFGLLFYGLGAFVETVLASPMASSFLYVPSALSMPVNAVIIAAWAGLKTLSGPL